MIKNHNISQNEVSEITGIPLRTVERSISNLKKKEIAKRIGSKRLGYWVVNSRMIKK